jgi:segregation and condensation protein A
MADQETDPTPAAPSAEAPASAAADDRGGVAQPLPGAPLDDRPDDDRDEAAYKVVLPAFHGPLDLLLHLIRQHKVDIYDIPIVLITQQFNKYLEAMEELDLEVAADYIYMAALLIHIKSKMLLPRDDEAGDAEDPRKELVDRLVEYQRFKAVAESFAELDVLRMGMWQRPPVPIPGNDEPTEIDMSEVSLFDLIDAFRTALARYKQNHPTAIELKRITHKVSDKMREIYQLVREKSEVRLGWLLEGRGREELIAIFLGTLELVRLGGVALKQSSNFGEIVISSTKTEIDQATFDLFDDR